MCPKENLENIRKRREGKEKPIYSLNPQRSKLLHFAIFLAGFSSVTVFYVLKIILFI